ncbi:signal transducer and transcription activator [Drosophila willistoni]|uniref:signal transducer and transcription activator n=1 Tax=Drosophila willistoni TaxID=7260 RepID=UPI001F07E941|nr:signal transducer and transcription activator [Drosophila willistoni]
MDGISVFSAELEQLVSDLQELQFQSEFYQNHLNFETTIHNIFVRYCTLTPFVEEYRNCQISNGPNFTSHQCRSFKFLIQFFNNILNLSNGIVSDSIHQIRTRIRKDKFNLMKLVCHVDISTQVLKKGIYVKAEFRCLFADELHMPAPEVYCNIISSNQIRQLQERLDSFRIDIERAPVLENNSQILTYRDDKRLATFNNLKLQKTKRFDNTIPVLEEKCALLFHVQILINNQMECIWALSKPVVQASHSNQERLADATIFWMNNFPNETDEPFTVQQSVSCENLKAALVHEFNIRTNFLLHAVNIEYIREILLEFEENELITSEKIFRTHWKQDRSFWEWFYSLMKFLQPRSNNNNEENNNRQDVSVSAMWNAGLIAGFISRQRAVDFLENYSVGTFLIRFSETNLNSLNIVEKVSNTSVYIHPPFEPQLVEATSLANCIYNSTRAQFLCSPHRERVLNRDEVLQEFIRPPLAAPNYPQLMLM